MPITRPAGPTSREVRKASRPVPQPRSTTAAPVAAAGIGEPQP